MNINDAIMERMRGAQIGAAGTSAKRTTPCQTGTLSGGDFAPEPPLNISSLIESISNRLGDAQQFAYVIADQLGGTVPSDPSQVGQAPADVMGKLLNISSRLNMLLDDLRRANSHI